MRGFVTLRVILAYIFSQMLPKILLCTVTQKKRKQFNDTVLGVKIIDCQNDSISVTLPFKTEFRRVMDVGLCFGGNTLKSSLFTITFSLIIVFTKF